MVIDQPNRGGCLETGPISSQSTRSLRLLGAPGEKKNRNRDAQSFAVRGVCDCSRLGHRPERVVAKRSQSQVLKFRVKVGILAGNLKLQEKGKSLKENLKMCNEIFSN